MVGAIIEQYGHKNSYASTMVTLASLAPMTGSLGSIGTAYNCWVSSSGGTLVFKNAFVGAFAPRRRVLVLLAADDESRGGDREKYLTHGGILHSPIGLSRRTVATPCG
jgi:hypothetical protein